jgi:hypothetical protein
VGVSPLTRRSAALIRPTSCRVGPDGGGPAPASVSRSFLPVVPEDRVVLVDRRTRQTVSLEGAPGAGLEPASIRIQSPAFFQLNYPGPATG